VWSVVGSDEVSVITSLVSIENDCSLGKIGSSSYGLLNDNDRVNLNAEEPQRNPRNNRTSF
jgi:hypothetical protein